MIENGITRCNHKAAYHIISIQSSWSCFKNKVLIHHLNIMLQSESQKHQMDDLQGSFKISIFYSEFAMSFKKSQFSHEMYLLII